MVDGVLLGFDMSLVKDGLLLHLLPPEIGGLRGGAWMTRPRDFEGANVDGRVANNLFSRSNFSVRRILGNSSDRIRTSARYTMNHVSCPYVSTKSRMTSP